MIAAKPRSEKSKLKNRRWTFDELAAELPESNLPTELWDGELIMSPTPTFFHQQIVDRFHDHLKSWVRKHRLGETATAPLDMILTTRRTTQPDVLFISNERLHILTDRIRGAADLVVEVISPESRRRDRIDKRDLYEQHGVREYWLIDPEAKTVEVLHLESGEFKLAGRWHPGERAQSRLLKGFQVAVKDLFGEAQSSPLKVISRSKHLNTAGLRKDCREIYPSREILQLAFNKGVPITFGSDGHAPEEVGMNFTEAIQLARSVGYQRTSNFEKRNRQTIEL